MWVNVHSDTCRGKALMTDLYTTKSYQTSLRCLLIISDLFDYQLSGFIQILLYLPTHRFAIYSNIIHNLSALRNNAGPYSTQSSSPVAIPG